MNITITEHKTIKLTPKQVTKITRDKLSDLTSGYIIEERNGKRVLIEWIDTGHGSGLTRIIGPATQLDEALHTVLNALEV